MQSSEQLVRRAYEAQAQGDFEAYLALMDDGFVLHIPGRSQIAGDYRGAAALRRHFAEIAALSGGTFMTRVHDVLASEEHVVALIEAHGERDGRRVSLPRVHVWHVRAGRLMELWLHPADQFAFDEYWGERASA